MSAHYFMVHGRRCLCARPLRSHATNAAAGVSELPSSSRLTDVGRRERGSNACGGSDPSTTPSKQTSCLKRLSEDPSSQQQPSAHALVVLVS